MNLKQEAFDQGLNEEEYQKILDILQRKPNSVELSIFAVMWSEHCSYKSSRVHLKKLPTTGKRVVQGPGENAGVIDIDDGDYLAFKIESHNHPSYIEPFQGAATGVGGILRDIFAMGARPIAVLDSIHFGQLSHPKTPMLMKGVVAGISNYGNCMGIPNIGGETHFSECYNGNILVNAMALGLLKKDKIQKGIAQGEGRVVLYLGAPTGSDGVHGATMASEEFSEDSEAKRPTVQVGDPFFQKILMEACLEMVEQNLLFGIQDMGAAGITCSTFEMSAKGNSGMDIYLDKIPQRQKNMQPFELFLSESQERMLLVVDPEKVEEVEAIAKKWNVDCADIGRVKNEAKVTAYFKGEKIVDLPVMPITEEAPVYNRPYKKPNLGQGTRSQKDVYTHFGNEKNALDALIHLEVEGLKDVVFNQYDSTVKSDTVFGPGNESGILRFKGSDKKIAVTVDSRAALCESNPNLGIQHVIAESVLNLACVGAKAVAISNCLNFGNPEEENIMGQFEQTIEGLTKASIQFDAPITGGNVSFYNQTEDVNIYPTPSIGMVGLMKTKHQPTSSYFKFEGDLVYILQGADLRKEYYNSLLTEVLMKHKNLQCPPINLETVQQVQHALLALHQNDSLSMAKDCSEGGLALALMEASVHSRHPMGVNFTVNKTPEEQMHFLMSEQEARVVIAFNPSKKNAVETLLTQFKVMYECIGHVQPEVLSISKDAHYDLSELQKKLKKDWI